MQSLMTSGFILLLCGHLSFAYLPKAKINVFNSKTIVKIKEDEESKLLLFDGSKQIFTLRYDHPDFLKMYTKITQSQKEAKPISFEVDANLNIVKVSE